MTARLTIWCNANFPEDAARELSSGIGDHRLIWADQATTNLAAGDRSEALAEADVAFGQPDPQQVIDLPSLRWIHLTSAGYTRYDRDDIRQALIARGAVLTNSSSVYNEPCAQHLLAFMLAQARQLPQAMTAQVRGEGWVYDQLRPAARVLKGETILILGFGAIARRLAQLLALFELNLMAVRQHVRGDEPIPVHPIADLDRLLPLADHVVNALPASASTDRLLNARSFSAMKPSAMLYNIGRGSTVDQPALIDALNSGQLKAAYLDVTDPEPLPPGHPLWAAPNCFITPHIGGGMQEEPSALVRHFLANLRRFECGHPLVDTVM